MAAQPTLTIGSRGSQLALWQAHYIAGQLAEAGFDTRIEIIKTTGDHLQTASLTQAGGKGLFTKEIEEALLAGHIDLAVHSLKDLPTESPEGLTIAAVPLRASPFDAIVGERLAELERGARVGTSSPRRGAQLRILRPDLRIEPIRGNVDTRLKKQHSGEFDAILLAAAGLERLGLGPAIPHISPMMLSRLRKYSSPIRSALRQDKERWVCRRAIMAKHWRFASCSTMSHRTKRSERNAACWRVWEADANCRLARLRWWVETR